MRSKDPVGGHQTQVRKRQPCCAAPVTAAETEILPDGEESPADQNCKKDSDKPLDQSIRLRVSYESSPWTNDFETDESSSVCRRLDSNRYIRQFRELAVPGSTLVCKEYRSCLRIRRCPFRIIETSSRKNKCPVRNRNSRVGSV